MTMGTTEVGALEHSHAVVPALINRQVAVAFVHITALQKPELELRLSLGHSDGVELMRRARVGMQANINITVKSPGSKLNHQGRGLAGFGRPDTGTRRTTSAPPKILRQC